MKLMMRKAFVRWKGGAKGGTQFISTESRALNHTPCSCSSGIPLKENSAVDPAELIAAAHASSYSSALSHELGTVNGSGEIVTTATVTLEHLAAGWTIMDIHLNVVATVPKVSQREFIAATVRAKTSCVVSRLLRANVSLTTKLESSQ